MKRFPQQHFLRLLPRLGTAVIILSLAGASPASSDITIEIRPDKKEYSLSEPVTGEVIVTSHIPATFPMTFTVRIYQDGRLYSRRLVNAPVFFGDTSFSFKNFGLGDIGGSEEFAGDWRVTIDRANKENEFTSARFSISADGEEPGNNLSDNQSKRY